MKRLPLRASNLCQVCRFISAQTSRKACLPRSCSSLAGVAARPRWPRQQLALARGRGNSVEQLKAHTRRWASNHTPSATEVAVRQLLPTIRQQIQTILSQKAELKISENDALKALDALETMSKALVGGPPSETIVGTNPASALLGLDAKTPLQNSPQSSPQHNIPSHYRNVAEAEISKLAHDIIKHPRVFITPAILKTYISIQTLVGLPETLPEAFALYASKPIPKANAPSAQYKSPNPHKASFAIPAFVADTALTAAIQKRDLSLALAIIDTTVCTPAFHRSKIIRKALPPLTGFALAPLAVYTLASQLSVYQESMDSAMATNVAFAGILAYVGFTATIGIVAVTTANDQMDRVTWATGMPLRERWLREEERAALDRVAGAWGFKETSRRGEEEGQEWEELREWIGRRGMILDRVSLMEGME
ncbi:hypothetical protein MMC16_003697 [Acarospora aff. strigata]|nr:hypothetical protein [Acarospora aff. strigata]